MEQITPKQLLNLLEVIANRLELIDIRAKYEFLPFHLACSKSIPLGNFKTKIKEIDPKKIIIIISQSGLGSKRAINILQKEKRFKDSQIFNLEDGIEGILTHPLGKLAMVKARDVCQK